MKAERLFRVLELVDEDLIEEAASPPPASGTFLCGKPWQRPPAWF